MPRDATPDGGFALNGKLQIVEQGVATKVPEMGPTNVPEMGSTTGAASPRVLPPGVSAASGAPPARRRVLARVGPGGTAAAGVPAL